MTRQVYSQQGRVLNPLQAVLFFSALLVFICTVVYRMLKSDSLSQAMAMLVESLLVVAFFIFLGVLLAYLLYFIFNRLHKKSRRRPAHNMFDSSTGRDKTACRPDHSLIEPGSKNEAGHRLNS
jgi:predicted membrane protein